MSIGFWQIAIVVVLVVLLFGRGKISSLMGDVAKGIKSFKKGMNDPVQDQPDSTPSVQDQPDSTSSQDQPDSTSSHDQTSEEENSDKK